MGGVVSQGWMGCTRIVGCWVSGAETWALVYTKTGGKPGDWWAAGEYIALGETTVGDRADRDVNRRRV